MPGKFSELSARELAVLLHGLATVLDDPMLGKEAKVLTDEIHSEQTERYRDLLQNMRCI